MRKIRKQRKRISIEKTDASRRVGRTDERTTKGPDGERVDFCRDVQRTFAKKAIERATKGGTKTNPPHQSCNVCGKQEKKASNMRKNRK